MYIDIKEQRGQYWFDKKNAFDVEHYLKHELRLRMDEEFDCYEVDLTPATEEATA